MSLLFDLTATQSGTSTFTGGNEYAKAVFLRLVERHAEAVVAYSDPRRPLDPLIETAAVHVEHIRASSKIDVQHLVDRSDINILYSALPAEDVWRLDLRSVHWRFTLHGLRAYEVPTDLAEWWAAPGARARAKVAIKAIGRRAYRARMLRYYRRFISIPARSVHVFVPSEHTKYSLLTAVPELEMGSVEVFFSPPKSIGNRALQADEAQALLARMGVSDGEYVLVISGDRWLKNGIRAARALDQLYSRRPDVRLKTLVLGVTERGRYLKQLVHTDRVSFGPYVSPEELESLYARAFALLYPTLSEGFGYPPLECMRYGTPVVCGAVSSVPEVCGCAALYVDPRSDDEMQARILQLATDSGLRNEIGVRGRRRSAELHERQVTMLDQMIDSLIASDASV